MVVVFLCISHILLRKDFHPNFSSLVLTSTLIAIEKQKHFYMIPRPHKIQLFNHIIAKNLLEYIKINEILDTERRNIVAVSAYCTHVISITNS